VSPSFRIRVAGAGGAVFSSEDRSLMPVSCRRAAGVRRHGPAVRPAEGAVFSLSVSLSLSLSLSLSRSLARSLSLARLLAPPLFVTAPFPFPVFFITAPC
jgi:hypothetical protein